MEAPVAAAGACVRATRRGHRPRFLTVDVDGLPLPIPVEGHQTGSAWKGHFGERIFYPLIGSAAETGDMLGAMLRPGNAGSATDADTFIEDVVQRAEQHLCQVALVRMDAGFPSEHLMQRFEANGTPYLARLRANKALDRLAAPHIKRPAGRPPAEPRQWCHATTSPMPREPGPGSGV